MGIGGFFKRGIREMMIARPDAAKSLLIYKHPDPTIPSRSQLTVGADERVLFFKDGVCQGEFQAGRHTLRTSNFPFLSNFVDSFTGGDVFRAEVYFVTTRELPGTRFGGRIGNLQDPKSGLAVETMVHGSFSYRVEDPKKLVIGAVGLGREGGDTFTGWMKEQVLKVIRDRAAELIVKNQWPLLDVTSGAYTEEIADDVIEGVKRHLDSYGVKVMRMGNFVISIDEEDEANLKKLYTDAAYLRMVGGTSGYQQFAAGKAMMGAGEGFAKGGGGGGGGEAGGGMMAGAGLGMGFGMAQMFQGVNQGATSGAPASGGHNPADPHAAAGSTAASAESSESDEEVECLSCSARVPAGKFCSSCGKPLQAKAVAKEEAPVFCSGCGRKAEDGDRFCGGCGASLAD